MPGVPQLVSEGDDVVHGAGIGDEDPRLHRIGKLGAVGPGAPVRGGGGVNPAALGHHAGERPHLGIETGKGQGDDLDRLLERYAAVAARRGRREQILRPQLLDAEPPGHQPQGPLTQMARLPGLPHQGIQGRPLDVALVAGEIQGIQGPHPAALARELQAPAVEGVEDGGHRLLLPLPTGADGVEGLFALRPIRAGEQVARLCQPPLLAGYLHPDLAHQIVVEVAPGVQAVGAKADDQLLRLHRQPLILQAALVAQPVLLLPEQGILHQLPELGLGQPQHQIFDGRQRLEQVRIEGPGAGGQLLGQGIPGILAPRAGRQHGDVPTDLADTPGPQPHFS